MDFAHISVFLYGIICCAESPVQDEIQDNVETVETQAVNGGEILSPKIHSQKSRMTLPENPKPKTFDYDVQELQEDKRPEIDQRPLSERILDDLIMKIIIAKYEEQYSQQSPISKFPHAPANTTISYDEESKDNDRETRVHEEDKLNDQESRSNNWEGKTKSGESKGNEEFVRQIQNVIIESTVRKNEIKPKKPPRPPAPKRNCHGLQTDLGQVNTEIVRDIINDLINDATCSKDSKFSKRPPAPKKSLSVMEINHKYNPPLPKRPLPHKSIPSPTIIKPQERHILQKFPLPPLEQVSTRIQPTKPPRPPAMKTTSPKKQTRPPLPIGQSKQITPQGKSRSPSSKCRASPTRPQRPVRPPKPRPPRPKEPQKPIRPQRPGETSRPIQMCKNPEMPTRPQKTPILKESQNLTTPRRPPRQKSPSVVQTENEHPSLDDYPDELNPFADEPDDDKNCIDDESDYETADSYTDDRIDDEYPDELNPFADDGKLKDDEFNDKYPNGLNPFGADDDPKDDEVNEYNATNATDDYPEELNPFANDNDRE